MLSFEAFNACLNKLSYFEEGEDKKNLCFEKFLVIGK